MEVLRDTIIAKDVLASIDRSRHCDVNFLADAASVFLSLKVPGGVRVANRSEECCELEHFRERFEDG